MKLEIDARAAARFNEIGEQVMAGVSKELPKKPPQGYFRPDVHIVAHLAEKDLIGSVRMVQDIINGAGDQVGRFFDYADHRVGLVGKPFRGLLRLLERIRSCGLQNVVSTNRLSSALPHRTGCWRVRPQDC